MNSTAYILGFVCGIAIVAIICIAIRMIAARKDGKAPAEYDERQAAIRGKGFQLAYSTAIITLVLGGLAEMATGVAWCDLFVLAMIALWTSICVFTTYCVIKDAYFTLRTRRKPLMIILAAAGIINLAVSIMHIAEGSYIIEAERLSTGFVNLLTGACCLYLGVMMALWTLHERRQECDE